MEAGGVYEAARRSSRPLLCVRGISDIVGFRRNDEWKDYACHTSAAFVKALIHFGPVCIRSRERLEHHVTVKAVEER